MIAFPLILAVLASAYGIFLAYLLINNPFHDLLFQPPPPSPPLPQPYAVVIDLCLNNYYIMKPGNCFVKLMQIPSTKYAADLTQIIRILVDHVYNSLSLSIKYKEKLISLSLSIKYKEKLNAYFEIIGIIKKMMIQTTYCEKTNLYVKCTRYGLSILERIKEILLYKKKTPEDHFSMIAYKHLSL